MDGGVHGFFGGHGDEREATRAAGHAVHDEGGLGDWAELAEEFTEISLRSVERNLSRIRQIWKQDES